MNGADVHVRARRVVDVVDGDVGEAVVGPAAFRRDVDVARDANANNAKRIKGRRKSTS